MGREEKTALESALALHGEAFMSMFDDHVISEGRRGAELEQEAQEEEEWDGHPIHDDDTTNAVAEEINDNDVDYIFKGIRDNHGEVLNLATKRSKPTKLKKKTNSTSMDGDDDVEDEVVRRRIEKKRFMSSKADVILGGDVSVRHSASTAKKKKSKKEPSSSNRGKDLMMEDKEEFKKLSREIQHFGASGLDKKSRAKFEENALIQLGAKKKKGARIPASIGIGMAKKAAQREKRALEQAIAAGMVSRKAASKKREQGKGGIDRGLNEDMGAFKGGVLRINKGSKRRKA
ncbi:hypothetical protein PSENEW3n2_00002157 [Picochlorum sp. SENEW3]|nr:hypothetical protein PSENEW3n2_00002157 [Picochlorum sp. SENEW3]WPT14927.1 hypothetical protein PSENEW3_00002157 [Picochlorum sp. SENEW3]